MSDKGQVRVGFKDRFEDFKRDILPSFGTVLFRRVLVLGTSLMLIGVGVVRSIRFQNHQAYVQLMTVTPSNIGRAFSISRTSIMIQDQFKSGDTFAIPIVIENYASLSPNAQNYELVLQGTKTPLSEDIQAKLYLFGTSGRGAIVIKGSYTGEPMNVYIQSNGTVDLDIKPTPVDYRDLQGLSLQVIEEGTFLQGDKAYGTMVVGGVEVPVSEDVVSFTVNPSAENVIQSEMQFDYDSTPSELYDAIFAPRDRASIRLERTAAENAKSEMIEAVQEYESRLQEQKDISEEDKQKVIGANAIALNSVGSEIDVNQMNDLLRSVGQASLSYSESVDSLSESEAEALRVRDVDLSHIGGNATTSEDILKVLAQLRGSIITVNRQMELADTKMRKVNDISLALNDSTSISNDFRIMRPY